MFKCFCLMPCFKIRMFDVCHHSTYDFLPCLPTLALHPCWRLFAMPGPVPWTSFELPQIGVSRWRHNGMSLFLFKDIQTSTDGTLQETNISHLGKFGKSSSNMPNIRGSNVNSLEGICLLFSCFMLNLYVYCIHINTQSPLSLPVRFQVIPPVRNGFQRRSCQRRICWVRFTWIFHILPMAYASCRPVGSMTGADILVAAVH